MIQLDAVLKDNVPEKKNPTQIGRERASSSVELRENLQPFFMKQNCFCLLLLMVGFLYVFVLLLHQYFPVAQCFQYSQFLSPEIFISVEI